YQSKGGGQGEWLGPSVEDVMDKLAATGHKEVLVAPVGFVSDHIETLYDIDIAQKRHAESRGLVFQRTEALNTSPEFIAALTAVVLGNLK
ncbi:MAG: ferrochelatase, partial [Bacillota bacterium]